MARKFDVHILLYTEDYISIAHCLEFDIVAQGKKKIEALKNLLGAIELQINFALENNDLSSIFTPAPAEYWKMLIDDDTTDLIDEHGMVYFVNQNKGEGKFG